MSAEMDLDGLGEWLAAVLACNPDGARRALQDVKWQIQDEIDRRVADAIHADKHGAD